MKETARLDLSVVVVTRDTARTLQPILAALAEQSIAERLEVVIVAPETEAGEPAPRFRDAFGECTVVPGGPIDNRGAAAALGVRAATAEFVAISENHCFPEKDWAERTLAAFRGNARVAIGPAVVNANPETTLSVAMHAAGYGLFPSDAEAGPRAGLPHHNSSYRRSVLTDFGETLEHLLADERRLQARLIEDGHDLFFDPSIVKRHINEATWRLVAGLALDCGRRYGGTRARGWPWWRKIVYAGATPLVSVPIFRRLRNLLPDDRSAGAHGLPLAFVMWVWAFLHACGEATAYLLGEKEVFPFTEEDEFMIRERLGGVALSDRRIRTLVDQLDA